MTTIRRQIRNLPWRTVRNIGFAARVALATKPVPEKDYILARASRGDIERIFRENHFREGWFLSWNYHGEDANLCRAEYQDEGEYSDYQSHVRVFERKVNRCILYPHYELDPIMHPRLHLNGVNHDVKRGIDTAKSILDRYEVDNTIIEA